MNLTNGPNKLRLMRTLIFLLLLLAGYEQAQTVTTTVASGSGRFPLP
jgi:hypothetical protein